MGKKRTATSPCREGIGQDPFHQFDTTVHTCYGMKHCYLVKMKNLTDFSQADLQ